MNKVVRTIKELGDDIDNIKKYDDLFDLVKEKTSLADSTIIREIRRLGYGKRYFNGKKKAPNLSNIDNKKMRYGGIAGFRERFDKGLIIPNKIEEGINKILKKNGWMYDIDFREACNVSPGDWRRYADRYEHLQCKVEGKLVWGHPEIIDEMIKVLAR